MMHMTRDWEATFRNWAGPLGDTEDARCAHAESAIRKAIDSHRPLQGRSIQVFAQGSYKHNTNVPAESDVDVCVLCTDTCFQDFSFTPGVTMQTVGLVPATYLYPQFKNDVEAALVARFGQPHVTRGKKAFTIRENTYRVQADALACFEHRRYLRNSGGSLYHECGTEFIADGSGSIVNWPVQHHELGVAKNKATGRRFKALTRVLKNLRNEMADSGVAAATIASFLIECLVYNVPDDRFGHTNYSDDLREIITMAWNATKTDQRCEQWVEVNERKWLFRTTQPWTREQANGFLLAAWHYVGFR